MRTLQLAAIQFIDDYELKPQENERFVYKYGDVFVTIICDDEIVELINVSVIRSMEVMRP